ncbi:MAG: 2-amino-4-hydroxy-6-hydroxymethyldihydropteridine diphosphokinase [Proteobacteria bacterium]|jgi:2-amino-4-hydroxy-6-hydroxymethyldihydropteridine diphosphokinase|nr:2-amino-4-hydroxy-6-hydroxymethyldihydropteridine diphosphokinase [Alphaproteobacteria bacterium]NCC03566.1 2-amino-4-hydroxy-6-hydroxymethyldihydropteridine diphosphokinase [Pseudomonadota bacterium]
MSEQDKAKHEVLLGLGGNIGDRLSFLRAAVVALAPFVEITETSGVYETIDVCPTDQPLFLNAAVRGWTRLDPLGLLYTVKDLEIELGRKPTFRFGPRTIDIDILFYDDIVLHTLDLSIPHPGVQERLFVLRPLMDIAPEWVHPVLKKNVETLYSELPQGGVSRRQGNLCERASL